MSELHNTTNSFEESAERENIIFLREIVDNPAAFLEAQNELLYDRDTSHFIITEGINALGLSDNTDEFYRRSHTDVVSISDRKPRVLNIGSGAEHTRKLSAINIDINGVGSPDLISGAQKLPFADNAFTVVRASHVLEHIPQSEIIDTLKEWKRVLNKNGELHIAVPDAKIVFDEIISGITPKGSIALSLTETTAPLAQIYGLGYENSQTDPRWRHTIIFSIALLENYLFQAGFSQVTVRPKEDDLAYYCGVDDDSQNHYSLLITARNEKDQHVLDEPYSEREFRAKCQDFVEKYPQRTAISYIIPVCNESKNIRSFLSFLENAQNRTETDREFIFVINGCTDDSEEIIRSYLKGTYLNAKIITSSKGILTAFQAGIASRDLSGFIGKIDADTVLHPHALDAMYMHLVENDSLEVTYAESRPLDAQSAYNEAEHNPIIRSKRLYYHGRASVYRRNPFELITSQGGIPIELKAEDIFLSFYYAYFHGLQSIERAPHAFVYARTVRNFRDLVTQVSRSRSEIDRVYGVFPAFRLIGKLLEREIYPGNYKKISERAESRAVYTDEWTQITNTK